MKLLELIQQGEVTWPCWWHGHADPWPIHDQWALYGAPWIFVLDAQGRIRFTDVRGEELEQAVQILMAEL